MELDDLKTVWNEQSIDSHDQESERTKVMGIIKGSHRGILRSFTIDLVVAVGLNLAFVVVVFMFGSRVMPFLFKLIIAANVVAVPIYYKLYKSMMYLKHLDFGRDLKSSLESFLEYYRETLRFYKRSTVLLIVALLLLFSLDNSFQQLEFWIRMAIVFYLGIFLASTSWLVDKLYGGRIHEIESYLSNS